MICENFSESWSREQSRIKTKPNYWLVRNPNFKRRFFTINFFLSNLLHLRPSWTCRRYCATDNFVYLAKVSGNHLKWKANVFLFIGTPPPVISLSRKANKTLGYCFVAFAVLGNATQFPRQKLEIFDSINSSPDHINYKPAEQIEFILIWCACHILFWFLWGTHKMSRYVRK